MLVLAQHKAVATDAVLTRVRDSTKVSKKMKGAEQRDAMFGRLFGYLAILRSGRLSSAKVSACCPAASIRVTCAVGRAS
jgi:hypothetical protein